MVVLIASYLLLVFVLPVALSAIVSYRSLPRGRSCLQCRGDMLLLRSRWLARVAAIERRTGVQRRFCLRCGWEGAVRAVVPDSPRPTSGSWLSRSGGRGTVAGGSRASGKVPAPTGRSTRTLDVRSLDVDGAAWRVMLQCWGRTGMFYGRFVFVAPTGRLWLDAVESFSGADHTDVLGQALSLPENLLEYRLRRLVTER